MVFSVAVPEKPHKEALGVHAAFRRRRFPAVGGRGRREREREGGGV